ncbi:MAG: ABC transporter permease [Dermatophilaceae bacterium]
MASEPYAGRPPERSWVPIFEYLLRVYRRTWRASAFGRVLSPVLMLVSLGFGLGSLVDRGAGISWHGQVVPYLQFVAPALIASQAMTTGLGESSWPVLGAIRWNGTYHAMLATPARTGDILRAHLANVAVQVAGAVVVFLAVASAFGAFRSWWVVLSLPVAMLTGLGFASLMTALAARALTETAFTLVFRLVMAPLMLFSGTFFPVESLPPLLRPIAWLTPLWHGVEACRSLALGEVSWPALGGQFLLLSGFLAGGWWVAARQLRRRLVV